MAPPQDHPKFASPDGHGKDIFFGPWIQIVMSGPSDDPTREVVRPAAELLAEVYAELRRLAATMAVRLPPGQTLQPTALVHEAYLKLVRNQDPGWEGRRHFF